MSSEELIIIHIAEGLFSFFLSAFLLDNTSSALPMNNCVGKPARLCRYGPSVQRTLRPQIVSLFCILVIPRLGPS